MKKTKIGFLYSLVIRCFGILFIMASLWLVIGGVQGYVAQHEQKEWPVVTAEVTDISSRVESYGTRNKKSRTVYDITYCYEVAGQAYTGQYTINSTIRLVGDEFTIKYNPQAPENSTTTLKPQLSDLLIPLFAALVFGAAGFCLSGLLALVLKLRRRGQPVEEEILPPEEYVTPAVETEKPKGPVVVIVQRILPVVIFAIMIFGSFYIFSGKKSVTTEQFVDAVESQGYVATDTTEYHREQWKIGSLLEQAMSLEIPDVRIDFCVMDTMDSTRRIYQGMQMPITEGTEHEESGLNHAFYSIENDEMYAAKIQIGTTVVYAGCTTENKELVMEILETIGYWDEE